MTKITIAHPPKTEAEAREKVVEIYQAAQRIGLPMEMQGFISTWVQENTRVVVGRDEKNEITDIGVFVFGRRWFSAASSASVLIAHGANRAEMLRFIRDSCQMLGVETMFYEAEDGDTIGGERARMMALKV